MRIDLRIYQLRHALQDVKYLADDFAMADSKCQRQL